MSKSSWAFEPGSVAAGLVEELKSATGVERFDLAVVLGSGWSEAAALGKQLASFDYCDWSCFPAGQIAGHQGKLSAVNFSGWNILFFSGRFHYYQGLSAFDASFPVRLASVLGCSRTLLTCATGGINQKILPGHFMVVEDHINLLGDNPLRGLPGDVFVDLVNTYQRDVYDHLLSRELGGLVVHRGVLAAMPGPSYETPAEIRFLRAMGADVVSMSTVHESIMARYLNIEVAAVAFAANFAAGISPGGISHDDVLACSSECASLFPVLIRNMVNAWQDVSAPMI